MSEDLIPKKEKNWKSILTIISLVIFWPIGLILVWFLAPWRRKIKIIVTLIIIVLPIVSLILIVIIVLTVTGGSWEGLSDFQSWFEQLDFQL
jgi:antibiotic biosynthesis monooxygenase (ABM) superfamily enzyme